MESNYHHEDSKYKFCEHIGSYFFNSFVNNYNRDSEEGSNNNTGNFFYLNKLHSQCKLGTPEYQNISNNFFMKNIDYNWTALYNNQSLSSNTINKDGCIFTISFDDKGEQLASSNHNHNIEIWDIDNKRVKKILTDHKEIVTGLEYFHNDPMYMMSCSLDKTIKLWKDYTPIHTFIEHSDWVRCISISPTNKYFLSGCVSSIVKLWDMEYRKVVCSINNLNPDPDLLNTVNSLLFTKGNENVFLSGLRSGSVKVFDLRMQEKGQSMLVNEFKAHKLKLNSVKLNHDDKYILTSGRDNLIRLWDFRKLPVNIFI
jgi:WD40 repeat protein